QKNYFIKLISHELRTPLNAIVGFASILRTMGLDEKVQKATHLIDENTQKLLSMTDVLLEKEIDEET
ncbi:MAG: sensor histidine kinase, partial [Prevotellaceae bacterium]|nr:sensor histidine kinase [Prevotellaceae bacterium]